MKKLILILVLLSVFMVGCGDKNIGGDKDEHGCLVGAGYSWCDSKQKCLRAWEEYCEEYADQFKGDDIKNFNDCVNAGNPVLESFPRQCKTADGRTFVEELAIGGQRDEHGCLGPAGYSWDEEIQACTRSWEVKEEDQRKAAKTAVEYIKPVKGLTVIQIDVLRCPGCFEVYFDTFGERANVQISNWIATESSLKNECGDSEQGICDESGVKGGDSAEAFNYCTEEQKKAEVCGEIFQPVCGWFDSSKVQCIKYPCAENFPNSCNACINPNVSYWTEGDCPK